MCINVWLGCVYILMLLLPVIIHENHMPLVLFMSSGLDDKITIERRFFLFMREVLERISVQSRRKHTFRFRKSTVIANSIFCLHSNPPPFSEHIIFSNLVRLWRPEIASSTTFGSYAGAIEIMRNVPNAVFPAIRALQRTNVIAYCMVWTKQIYFERGLIKLCVYVTVISFAITILFGCMRGRSYPPRSHVQYAQNSIKTRARNLHVHQ